MSRFPLWIKVLIILFIMQPSAEGKPKTIHIKCNDRKAETFVNSLVADATQQLPNPVLLPRHSGFVILTEGTITGLSSLSTNNTTKIICEDDIIEIRAHLNVEVIKAKYKWLRNLLTRNLEGFVNMKANHFEAFIHLVQTIDVESNDTHPIIKTCSLTEMELIDADVTGKEFITWPEVVITDPAIKAFKKVSRETVDDLFKDALDSHLKGVTLHIEE